MGRKIFSSGFGSPSPLSHQNELLKELPTLNSDECSNWFNCYSTTIFEHNDARLLRLKLQPRIAGSQQKWYLPILNNLYRRVNIFQKCCFSFPLFCSRVCWLRRLRGWGALIGIWEFFNNKPIDYMHVGVSVAVKPYWCPLTRKLPAVGYDSLLLWCLFGLPMRIQSPFLRHL